MHKIPGCITGQQHNVTVLIALVAVVAEVVDE